jgi:hypothetical protein
VTRVEYRRNRSPETVKKQAQAMRVWREGRITQQQDYYLRKRFGISFDDYSRMCSRQHGKCAICCAPPGNGRSKRFLHVDHDHKTGEVRGLLCNSCNLMIGMARDRADVLKAAAQYLDRHVVWRRISGTPKANSAQMPLLDCS